MSPKARNTVLSLMFDKMGFSFNEEDLPPKTRRSIRTLAKKVELARDHWNSSRKAKIKASNLRTYVFPFGLFGVSTLIVLIVLLVTLRSFYIVFFLPVCAFFFSLAYAFHNQSVKVQETADRYKLLGDNIWREVQEETSNLTERAYNDLTALHEARIGPTVKHVTVDFAKIVQAAKGRGIILETVECPHCKAPITIPKKGESFQCRFCGKTILAVNIFDKLKDLLTPK